jgi:TatD DNase family protein
VPFDSHNHLQSDRFGKQPEDLVSEMKAAGITGCVVNATREADWEAVADLARSFPGFVFPAYGIHPWFADTAEEGWEGRLGEMLERDPQASVGEVGLDGWVDSPGMDVQMPVFVKQAEIAAEMCRVMTVHCLKAWEELFAAMDQAGRWPEKFLMHSFGGSIEIAERLMKRQGAMFSFSGYFLHERKRKVLEVFKKLPKDRILLETDAPDMMPPDCLVTRALAEGANHPCNLETIARAFGQELGDGIIAQAAESGMKFWGFQPGIFPKIQR